MCGMIDDPDCPKGGKHRELEAANIKHSEEAVQKVISSINSFTNPFTIPDKTRLYSLASGAPVAKDVEEDVMKAESIGRAAKDKFIKERFQEGSPTSFFEPIKRNKLKTMESSSKAIKLTSTQGKVAINPHSVYRCYG